MATAAMVVSFDTYFVFFLQLDYHAMFVECYPVYLDPQLVFSIFCFVIVSLPRVCLDNILPNL